MAEEMREAAGEDEQELANEMAEAFLSENLPENVFGAPKAGALTSLTLSHVTLVTLDRALYKACISIGCTILCLTFLG